MLLQKNTKILNPFADQLKCFYLKVKCAIRMRNSNESTPGPYVYSPVFKAGLYVSKVVWISQKALFVLSLDQIIYGLSRFHKLDYI